MVIACGHRAIILDTSKNPSDLRDGAWIRRQGRFRPVLLRF
jgi:hypothetical protein